MPEVSYFNKHKSLYIVILTILIVILLVVTIIVAITVNKDFLLLLIVINFGLIICLVTFTCDDCDESDDDYYIAREDFDNIINETIRRYQETHITHVQEEPTSIRSSDTTLTIKSEP